MAARIHKHQITRWLGRLFVMLSLVASWGAQAAVESVPAVRLWCNADVIPWDCTYTSDTAAAQAQLDGQNAWPYVMASGTKFVLTSCDGNGTCGYKTYQFGVEVIGRGVLYFLIGSKVSCPTATPAYTFNPASGASGMCERSSACPILPVTPLPATNACAQALESIHTTQAQKDTACGTLTEAMQTGKSCLASKLANLGTPIPLAVTADIRNVTYQAHLREIWDKMEDIVEEMDQDPAMRTACAARRAEIAAEKGCDNAGRCVGACNQAGRNHCLRGRPSALNDAPHALGKALDVSEAGTIVPLKGVLNARIPPQSIQQFLDNPTDCKLIWGGTFSDNYDPIHFQVR